MPTATLIDGGEHEEFIERIGPNAYRGHRFYRVDTRDKFLALVAEGLPVDGQSWSAGAADLRVVGATPMRGEGGSCVVRVKYETPQGRGATQPPPTVGLLYTEAGHETATETLRYDLGAVAFPEGQEPQVSVFQPVVTVVHHRAAPLPLRTQLGIFDVLGPGGEPEQTRRSVLNNAPLTVPPRLGEPAGTPGTTFNKGELLLRGIDDQAVAGLWITRIRFWAAPDWRWVWRQEDAQGRPLTSTAYSPIYPEVDLSGLWPGA